MREKAEAKEITFSVSVNLDALDWSGRNKFKSIADEVYKQVIENITRRVMIMLEENDELAHLLHLIEGQAMDELYERYGMPKPDKT